VTVPERWLALRIEVTDPLPRELVAEALLRVGGRGVVEEPEAMVTYLPEPSEVEAVLSGLREELSTLEAIAGPESITWWWQPQEDWEELWKRGLEPRLVSPRILITPSWKSVSPAPGQVVVVVDPGMAFGTAEHATTRGCLRLLDPVLTGGEHVLDIGAGTAILSMAAARLGAARVVAVEVDPLACDAARENVVLNQVGDRVEIREEAATPESLVALGPADGVLANIESGGLRPLLGGLRGALAPQGWLILSGILATERDEMVGAARAVGLALEAEDREDEWWAGRFRPEASA